MMASKLDQKLEMTWSRKIERNIQLGRITNPYLEMFMFRVENWRHKWSAYFISSDNGLQNDSIQKDTGFINNNLQLVLRGCAFSLGNGAISKPFGEAFS